MAKPALDVCLGGRPAGILFRKDNGNLQFRYDSSYIAAKGPPLSVNLPVRAEAYSHRECLAFFGNLLPEEDVRRQVALATGISAANDYKLLERFGGDVAGATDLEEVGYPAWAQLAMEVGFPSRFLRQRTLPFVEQVMDAAERLSGGHDHAELPVKQIVAGIRKRAERLRRR
jgi:HipA-like protein